MQSQSERKSKHPYLNKNEGVHFLLLALTTVNTLLSWLCRITTHLGEHMAELNQKSHEVAILSHLFSFITFGAVIDEFDFLKPLTNVPISYTRHFNTTVCELTHSTAELSTLIQSYHGNHY